MDYLSVRNKGFLEKNIITIEIKCIKHSKILIKDKLQIKF